MNKIIGIGIFINGFFFMYEFIKYKVWKFKSIAEFFKYLIDKYEIDSSYKNQIKTALSSVSQNVILICFAFFIVIPYISVFIIFNRIK